MQSIATSSEQTAATAFCPAVQAILKIRPSQPDCKLQSEFEIIDDRTLSLTPSQIKRSSQNLN